MTLRETITEELLNAVEHPEQLENISRTYSRSKGPYYAALLDATNQLQDQLDELLEEISDAIEQKRLLEQQVTTQHEKRDGLAEEVQGAETRLTEGNARLAESLDTLDRVVDLERRGFGISPFSLSPHSATQMGAPVSAGVLVAQVVPGSAAGNAGLRAEDIIVELEDFLIPNTGQLSKLPITHPPGETVTVVFYRNSE